MADNGLPSLVNELDGASLREDFPLFANRESPFIFLDSAASAQRPQSVLDAMDSYYSHSHANVHRGVYQLAEEATALYEAARRRLGEFIHAPSPDREIVFTKNATEACNLAAQGLGRVILDKDSAILLTHLEHHANLVPWFILQEQLGFEIRYIPFDSEGYLNLENLETLMEGVSIVGVTLMSNVFGTITPLHEIVRAAHSQGAYVLADGAQYLPHFPFDVQASGVDLLAITGHKMCGPTGIGALWARQEILDLMTPFLGGGDMIADVRLDGFTPNIIPYKFEAGTPPIAEAVGWHAALDYLHAVGLEAIAAHDLMLTKLILAQFEDRLAGKARVVGPMSSVNRGGVISFEVLDVHPHDVAQVLDQYGVAVRAGHHCAKPLLYCIGMTATTRASTYLYNTPGDVDGLVAAIESAYKLFH